MDVLGLKGKKTKDDAEKFVLHILKIQACIWYYILVSNC